MSGYPDAPGHRGIDTSIAAAEALLPALASMQSQALRAIRDAGERGLTSDELAAVLGRERWEMRPRTSELKLKGAIRDSRMRRQNCTGKSAIVWVST